MSIISKKKGFTFVEVLIFVAIVSIFFITALFVVTQALRQTKTNINKLRAEHYANELMTWLRSEKEENWGGLLYNPPEPAVTFTEKASQSYPSSSNTIYCFNTDAIEWNNPIFSTHELSCPFVLQNTFRRYAILSFNTPPISQVTAEVVTEWKEGTNIFSSKLRSVFTLWE